MDEAAVVMMVQEATSGASVYVDILIEQLNLVVYSIFYLRNNFVIFRDKFQF